MICTKLCHMRCIQVESLWQIFDAWQLLIANTNFQICIGPFKTSDMQHKIFQQSENHHMHHLNVTIANTASDKRIYTYV